MHLRVDGQPAAAALSKAAPPPYLSRTSSESRIASPIRLNAMTVMIRMIAGG